MSLQIGFCFSCPLLLTVLYSVHIRSVVTVCLYSHLCLWKYAMNFDTPNLVHRCSQLIIAVDHQSYKAHTVLLHNTHITSADRYWIVQVLNLVYSSVTLNNRSFKYIDTVCLSFFHICVRVRLMQKRIDIIVVR